MKKEISAMTNKEILRQQLELLAKESINYGDGSDLYSFSNAMNSIYKSLSEPSRIAIFSIFFIAILHSLTCFIILVKNLFRRKR